MPLAFTQYQIENELSDAMPHGMREEIARGTGIYPKVVDAWFNPHDERKSPFFTVLHMMAVLDEASPGDGNAIWNLLNSMREASRPHVDDAELCVDHEMGRLSKEFSDIFVAKCEGKPVDAIQREIDEARRQLDTFEAAIYQKDVVNK